MEWFSLEFLSALFSIIIINLVLSGDNAIVIGMAARNLPKKQQKQAIFWGAAGAIVIRTAATVFVVWLLKIPGLLLVGGLILIWIAYKLLVEKKGHESVDSAGTTIWSAVRTILLADVVMSLDNVLAIAGAAKGNFFLVVLGLLMSVPIIIWGSNMILKWIERFRAIIFIGAGVLAWTAANMITDEPLIHSWIDESPLLKWGIVILIVAGVMAAGAVKNRKTEATEDAA
jgi:YjbE family integral membrane protein